MVTEPASSLWVPAPIVNAAYGGEISSFRRDKRVVLSNENMSEGETMSIF